LSTVGLHSARNDNNWPLGEYQFAPIHGTGTLYTPNPK
jgi:hypothetical protein